MSLLVSYINQVSNHVQYRYDANSFRRIAFNMEFFYHTLPMCLVLVDVGDHGVSTVYPPCAGLNWSIPVAATISILLDFINVDFLLINAF